MFNHHQPTQKFSNHGSPETSQIWSHWSWLMKHLRDGGYMALDCFRTVHSILLWITKPPSALTLFFKNFNFSFCAVPVNSTALLIIGGYSQDGALASVELLDIKSGRWEKLEDLPQPRYGHSCLLMELAGTEGILVSGGALTGSDVDFYDLRTKS